MLGLSLLLHIALIAFIPGFGIFLPAGDVPFIEIETILFLPETGEKSGTEIDSESRENAQEEFILRSDLSVSEPESFERSGMIGEWERTVLERESQPPDIPRTEETLENRPRIDPEALTVQVELQKRASKSSPEQPDSFTRPESATADDVTKNAAQPFDIVGLREEEPPSDTEAEFRGRDLPKLPENQTVRQPVTLAKASRTVQASSVAPPARAFQPQDESVPAMPELRLPGRTELPEIDEESLSLPHEEVHINRQTALLPDSDYLPDFHARPLSEVVNIAALVIIPKRQAEALRPVIEAEPLPPQRNFRQQVVKKEFVEPLPRLETSLPERDDSIAAEFEVPQISSERRENRAISQQKDEEPVFHPVFKDLTKNHAKAVLRRTTPIDVARVLPEPEDVELKRTRPNVQAASPQALLPVNQIFAFERPPPPEREETIVGKEEPPKLRRREVEATPTPAPLFRVRRATALQVKNSSPGAKPLPRLFVDSTTPQRERAAVTEPAPLSRSFGTRRAGLLPVEAAVLPAIEGEKAVVEQDVTLEEAAAEEFADEAVEFTIEGPASGRKVVYKPPRLPEVAIEMEVDIRLKFWVLPDGSVGEVVPLQRGDVRLERAAIQYLKSWRFTSVTDDREVWGIIPIRYTLQ